MPATKVDGCEPCRALRRAMARGEVDSAPKCETCRASRRARTAGRPRRVRTPKVYKKIWVDEIAVQFCADGLIHPSKLNRAERGAVVKELLGRNFLVPLSDAEIGARAGVSDMTAFRIRTGKSRG